MAHLYNHLGVLCRPPKAIKNPSLLRTQLPYVTPFSPKEQRWERAEIEIPGWGQIHGEILQDAVTEAEEAIIEAS